MKIFNKTDRVNSQQKYFWSADFCTGWLEDNFEKKTVSFKTRKAIS